MIRITIEQAFLGEDLYNCTMMDDGAVVSATKEPISLQVALLWAEQSADLYQIAEEHLREHE